MQPPMLHTTLNRKICSMLRSKDANDSADGPSSSMWLVGDRRNGYRYVSIKRINDWTKLFVVVKTGSVQKRLTKVMQSKT